MDISKKDLLHSNPQDYSRGLEASLAAADTTNADASVFLGLILS